MRRREALSTVAATVALGLAGRSGHAAQLPIERRFAICNETFEEPDFVRTCAMAAALGYGGIELDPSTLSADPVALGQRARNDIRCAMETSGLAYVGLHNALKSKSRQLHLTTSDEALRKATWSYFRELVNLASDLASGGQAPPVIVLGSGKQRDAIGGVTASVAQERVIEGLAALAPHAESKKVTILLEPLAPHLSNIFHTLAETTAVVERIASPAVQTIFDTHNTAAETASIEDLVSRHRAEIRHVHVNEMDGRYPGAADYPFERLLRALKTQSYRGWISVEVFDFKPDGPEVARRSIENLRRWANHPR